MLNRIWNFFKEYFYKSSNVKTAMLILAMKAENICDNLSILEERYSKMDRRRSDAKKIQKEIIALRKELDEVISEIHTLAAS